MWQKPTADRMVNAKFRVQTPAQVLQSFEMSAKCILKTADKPGVGHVRLEYNSNALEVNGTLSGNTIRTEVETFIEPYR